MKKIILFFSILFLAQFSHAQWTALSSETNFQVVFGLYVDEVENVLYAAGSEPRNGVAPFIPKVAKWDGATWTVLSNEGIASPILMAGSCMIRFNNELYLGMRSYGSVSDTNSSRVLKWTGTKWQQVGRGFNGEIYSFAVFNNELYVGGSFINCGDQKVNNLVKLQNGKWLSVYSGFGLNGSIYTLKVIDNELYLGGYFYQINGSTFRGLAKYNGTDFLRIPNINEGTDGNIHSFQKMNNKLYMLGDFGTFNGNSNIKNAAVFDGTNLSRLGNADNAIVCSQIYNNKLYTSYKISGFEGRVQVLNDTESDFEKVFGNVVGNVQAMTEYKGELYIAGDITQVNYTLPSATPVNKIAKLGGFSGITKNKENTELTIYPNPSNSFINLNVPTNGVLELIDLSGRVVLRINHVFNTPVDISGVDKGYYTLRFTDDQNKIYLNKFLKN